MHYLKPKVYIFSLKPKVSYLYNSQLEWCVAFVIIKWLIQLTCIVYTSYFTTWVVIEEMYAIKKTHKQSIHNHLINCAI
jgi:hypothetical protein